MTNFVNLQLLRLLMTAACYFLSSNDLFRSFGLLENLSIILIAPNFTKDPPSREMFGIFQGVNLIDLITTKQLDMFQSIVMVNTFRKFT